MPYTIRQCFDEWYCSQSYLVTSGCTDSVTHKWQSQVENKHYSVGGVIEIQTAITKDCSIVSSIGSVHVVQSFIKEHMQQIWSDFNKAF